MAAVVEGGVVARELLRHFRNMETHVVGGSGHALFVDCREEFVKLLFMFVGKLSVSGPVSPRRASPRRGAVPFLTQRS